MKSIKISDENYVRLLKLKASLTAMNGHARTFDDIINEVLSHYEKAGS